VRGRESASTNDPGSNLDARRLRLVEQLVACRGELVERDLAGLLRIVHFELEIGKRRQASSTQALAPAATSCFITAPRSRLSASSRAFCGACGRPRRILEQILPTGYPEGQSSTPYNSRGAQIRTPQEENLDHGCAQAQDVACEYP
jgi:hypothetical protein